MIRKKPYKKKKCKNCKKEYTPVKQFQTACSISCAIELSQKKKKQKQKQETKKLKESLKTVGEYIKEAQAAVNAYVRERDRFTSCISCGTPLYLLKHGRGGSYDAGHYRSRGAAPHLRFNTLNIFGQCKRCNRYLSSNHEEMRKGILQRKGPEYLQRLEAMNYGKKFTIDYLKRIKRIFQKRKRHLIKLRGKLIRTH